MAKNKNIRFIFVATSLVLAAIGTKVSLAYWASAVTGSNGNANGTVTSGSWDRYTTGTAIGTCAALRTSVLQVATSATFHLTANLDCSATASPTGTPTFSGILYGNGYTISNYAISNTRGGLFYNLSAATIQNLILSNIQVGTSSSRVANFAGILAGQSNGATTAISRIRIYNSAVYSNNALGAGSILGNITRNTNVSNVFAKNVIINNSNASAGGIVGRLTGATATISDIYFEGTINSTTGAGGILGTVVNTNKTIAVISRTVVYGNTTITTSGQYAGGVVGNNLRSSTSHSLTDIFFTGALNASTNSAGTISNNVAMAYSNAWAAQWSSSTIAAYTNMTGQSANYSTNYVALRTSLISTWWSTNIPNISSSGFWEYNGTTYLFELKPKV